MELVRFNAGMGMLVKLVSSVLRDVGNLFLFLCLWICLFALLYVALGYQTVGTPLDELGYWNYFIISWKVATKGSNHNYANPSIWQQKSSLSFMDHLIMVLEIFNEIYLKIIILSFLIAIVKKSFDTQMKSATQNNYKQRCDMNKESSSMFRQVGLLQETDVLVLSAQFEQA